MGGCNIPQKGGGHISFRHLCVPSGDPAGCVVKLGSLPPPHTAYVSEEGGRKTAGLAKVRQLKGLMLFEQGYELSRCCCSLSRQAP